MNKVLLVTYGGGHAKIIEKIYEELSKTNKYEIVLLGLTSAVPYFKKKGISVKSIADYDYKVTCRIEDVLELMPDYKKNIHMTQAEHERYNLISIDNLLRQYTFSQAKILLEKFSRRVYLPVDFMTHVIEMEKPDLVITTTSPRMERAALISAKKLKIKSISIEDLFAERRDIDISIDKYLGTKLYSETYGDYIFVMNQLVKDKLIDYGIDSSRVFITGNPNFDNLLKYNKMTIKSNYNNRKQNNFKLLYLAQQSVYFDLIVSELKRIVNYNKYYLTIKLHPNQRNTYSNSFNITYTNENLYENILSADLAITEYSTSGLEALIINKKLLSIQLDDLNIKVIPFEKFDNTLLIKDINQLEGVIKILLESGFIKNEINISQDFVSSQRCIAIIKQIINNEAPLN